ncbi:MAG: dehydrogenase E1 component subunit alpha/beta [Alphaproteobacteria bacterium]
MTGSHSFRSHLEAGHLPARLTTLTPAEVGLTPSAVMDLFESQLISRHLDLAARRLAGERKTFYSIGSAGHEGNAVLARASRLSDMAFLHYRSGAFLLERSRAAPGGTPLWDMALSFAASVEDPCSGGRHKVLGSKLLNVPPQTSTIASHLPKAMGAAFAAGLARGLRKTDTAIGSDGIVLCSFGDASANHSTAQGAINAACWTAFKGIPIPLLLVCEDNGIGISVPTPRGWIEAVFSARPGLTYVKADGRDLLDAWRAARHAVALTRRGRAPVFLHLRTVRLMGHAGSDVETAYRGRDLIEAETREDPLLHGARIILEAGFLDLEGLLDFDARIAERVAHVMEAAAGRPRLETPEEIAKPIVPHPDGPWRVAPLPRPVPRATVDAARSLDARALETPQHLSRMISLTLADLMAEDGNIVVFGEDVGAKGGVYGATVRLQEKFGPRRVIDTLLDEQSILGLAIGLAQNGFLPIPEIQFLAYVHNAEDQIRGEAATLSFFSQGQFANPMVIRVAGLGYQKGFGGHFHNDNSLAVFRDVPGLVILCPSCAAEAPGLLRRAVHLAREQGRVVIFLEPIALYGTKDLLEEGDGAMLSPVPPTDAPLPDIGVPKIFGDGEDLAIVTYGNGTFLSRRTITRLHKDHGVAARVIDLRWLKPLAMERILEAVGPARSVLIVDECRRTGSLSEALMTGFCEHRFSRPVARITGEDSFIPLGPAATAVLPGEDGILAAALRLAAEGERAQGRGAA